MRLVVLAGFLALNSLAWSASFDQPVFKKTVDLGPSPARTGDHAKVTCYFFRHFMVKEVDMGEKGAERLAIVPIDKTFGHICTRRHDPGEKEISSDGWSGYFKGVKGDLVFFDADDGWNGGLGFAIYNAKTAGKIFDDVALGPLELTERDSLLLLRYTRVADGGCVMPKDSAACWEKISKKLGLAEQKPPDCQAGYDKSAKELAKGRCQAQNADNTECLAKELPLAQSQAADASSVIVYPVELVLDPAPQLHAVKGELRCWPSD